MTPVVALAGGGTGGHLYPGLAIKEQLEAIAPARCVFLCSTRPLDAEILGREGVEFDAIPAAPMSLRPRGLLRFARSWGRSVRAARTVIRREAAGGAPVHLVAMGGFVAAPCVQAARAERCTVTLVNLDAVPGRANRWIARHAARIVTSTPVADESWPVVPPIVRKAAINSMPKPECRTALGLAPDLPTLLVTGASQGARSINRLMMALLARERGAFGYPAAPSRIQDRHGVAGYPWQVIHQTGRGEDDAVRAAYTGAGVPALVQPFFDRMGLAWGAADLAVSRAGAGSVAEAWASRVPTVFLPYPYHRDQHQRFNARPLEAAGGAVIATDRIEESANLPGAGRVIVELMKDAAARSEMGAALARLGPVDGAQRVARLLLAGNETPHPVGLAGRP
ncbi:MAG: glycosyltransferase [Phycisphaerales bacterium]|nr:glycosyltransferase [Phycisphaerales bacterium]